PPEHGWIPEIRIEADEAAHRRAEHRRRGTIGRGAKLAVDSRFQRLGQEGEVGIGFAAAVLLVGKWTVLVESLVAGVMNADDNRLEAPAVEPLERRLQIPGPRVGGGWIGQILAVLHVDDGI